MTFPSPHNPQSLPLAPGYRWIGLTDQRKSTDEVLVHDDGPKGYETVPVWRTLDPESWGSTWSAWSIRRAICIDDPMAPPPESWSRDGYETVRIDVSIPKVAHDDEWYWWASCLTGTTGWHASCNGSYGVVQGRTHRYIRRPIGQPVAGPSVPAPKRQSLAIKTHGCSRLNAIIQDLLFEAGYQWGSGPAHEGRVRQHLNAHWLFVSAMGPQDELMAGGAGCTPQTGFLSLDSKTDLGQIMDQLKALSAPPSVHAPQPPTINGYVGQYTKGYASITFGCAKISVPMLRMAYETMKDQWTGMNRTIASVTLSSGVVLKQSDIETVLTYVEAIGPYDSYVPMGRNLRAAWSVAL